MEHAGYDNENPPLLLWGESEIGFDMFLTLMNGLCLIALGLAGFFGWEKMGETGNPAGMMMPVFFGGALVICVAFCRQSFRHGLYGTLIVALLGVVSAAIRIYQYESFQALEMPKTRLILAMGGLCLMQILVSWNEVKKDRNFKPEDF